MKVPKNMLLRLLKSALDSGEFTADEIRALLPSKIKRRKIQPREIIDAVHALSEEHKLADDGLRFGSQVRETKNSSHFHLYLLTIDGGKVAAKGVGESFQGLNDLPDAADKVIANYLATLAGAE